MTFLRTLVAALLCATVQLASAQSASRDDTIPLALIEGLSGSFANAGEAVYRNLLLAVERVNQRGGVKLPGGARRLELQRYDSQGGAEEAQAMLRAALDTPRSGA